MDIRRLAMSAILSVLSVSAQAETCPEASAVNGLDIDLPCVQVGTTVYRSGLKALSGYPQLTWQWNGVLEPASCSPNAATCTTLGSDTGLTINALRFNGISYALQLAFAPDLQGMTAWRYRSHVVNPTTPASPVLNDAALASLRDYMNSVVGVDKQVPGAVLGIAQGGTIVFQEAFGFSDVGAGTAMRVDNLLHIASTHKALTSFLIAVLVDEGVLQWDTRAQEIYPAFTTTDPQTAATITMRQLLDMSSGLPREASLSTDAQARQLFDQLGAQTLVGRPGEKYQYSNLGTSLAGYLAVLAVAKKNNGQITDADLNNLYGGYVALLRDKVLNPLGMANSHVARADAVATGRMAKSHAVQDGRFVVSESVDPAQDNSAPSGGLKSTLGDMLRYIITDMQQGVTPEGSRVGSAANVGERQKPSPGPATAEEYGLCLEVKNQNGLRYVGHTGSFDNFNSVMGFFPDKNIAFVLLTNGESPGALSLTGNGLPEKVAGLLGSAQ